MRVLHIIDSLVAGGKERQFVELLKGLRGHREVRCSAVVLSERIDYPEFRELDVETAIIPRRNRRDFSLYARLHKLMRAHRPDIVQSWNSMCTVYAAPIAKLAGSRFIDGSLRAAPPQVSLRDPDYFRFRLMLPFADRVVSNSCAGLAAYHAPPGKSVCIRNGFDGTRAATAVSGEATRKRLGIHTKFVVGMTAAFTRYKDYGLFLAAAKQMTAVREDVTFVAVGDGPELARFRDALPPTKYPNIKFLGYRPDTDNVAAMFTVGVLLSTTGEGISNSLMECMALAKPVVATDCSGNRELVEDGQSGFLVANGAVSHLVERLQQLLDDPALAKRLGDRGRERIWSEFSLERMTDSYVRLYREVVGRA